MAYAQLATDDFNRADGGLGANWTTFVAAGFTAPAIVSNQVNNTAGSQRYAYYTAISWPANQYAQVAAITNTGATATNILLRTTSSGGYANSFNPAAASAAIYRFVGGTFTKLSGGTTQAIEGGAVLRGEVLGSQLTMLYNGTSIQTVSDAAFSSGSAGAGAFGGGTSVFDDWAGGYVGTTYEVAASVADSPSTSTAIVADIVGNIAAVSSPALSSSPLLDAVSSSSIADSPTANVSAALGIDVAMVLADILTFVETASLDATASFTLSISPSDETVEDSGGEIEGTVIFTNNLGIVVVSSLVPFVPPAPLVDIFDIRSVRVLAEWDVEEVEVVIG